VDVSPVVTDLDRVLVCTAVVDVLSLSSVEVGQPQEMRKQTYLTLVLLDNRGILK
jgi:hypothetical protein